MSSHLSAAAAVRGPASTDAAAVRSRARHRRWVLAASLPLFVVGIAALACAASRGHQASTLPAHIYLWASSPTRALRALIALRPHW
jgi:hypothetical protein